MILQKTGQFMTVTPDTLSHAMVLETSADKLIKRLSYELDEAKDEARRWYDLWSESADTAIALRAERDMLATRAAAQAHEIARLMGELQKLQPQTPEPEVGGIGNAISVTQRGGVR